MRKIDVCHLSQDKHRSLMNQKIRIKNITILSSIIIALGLLVIFDHQRVNNDFVNLRADLMSIRFNTITEKNPGIGEFYVNKVSVLDCVLPAGTHSSIFLGAVQALQGKYSA